MPDDTKRTATVRTRALTAMAVIIGFIVAIVLLDNFIKFIILSYFPQFVSYIKYISAALNLLLAIFGIYVIYKVLSALLEARETNRLDVSNMEVTKLLLRILFYIIAIALVLIAFGPSLGVSLTQILAGSAIGGIIIGLAVQTVTSSILSGFLVSSSKTLVKGDIVSIYASTWGGSMVCRVLAVNTLFTLVETQNGNRVKLPNTILLTSTTFTKLNTGSYHSFPLLVSINSDVPVEKLDVKARAGLKKAFTKIKRDAPQIYISSRIAGSVTFTILLTFENFSELNNLVDLTNRTFDDAYWSIKSAKK